MNDFAAAAEHLPSDIPTAVAVGVGAAFAIARQSIHSLAPLPANAPVIIDGAISVAIGVVGDAIPPEWADVAKTAIQAASVIAWRAIQPTAVLVSSDAELKATILD